MKTRDGIDDDDHDYDRDAPFQNRRVFVRDGAGECKWQAQDVVVAAVFLLAFLGRSALFLLFPALLGVLAAVVGGSTGFPNRHQCI